MILEMYLELLAIGWVVSLACMVDKLRITNGSARNNNVSFACT